MERAKPASSQGARTKARESRRLMKLLGWLDDASRLTDTGITLVAEATPPEVRAEIIRQSLVGIELDDHGSASHPMIILLRLIGEGAFTTRAGMEAALAAANDSEAEYQRVKSISVQSYEERSTAFEASDNTMANSIKVLPALAERAGLILFRDGVYRLTVDGAGLLDTARGVHRTARPHPTEPTPRGARVPIDFSTVDNPNDPDRPPADARTRTEEEQRESVRRLLERSRRHEVLIRGTGALIGLAQLSYHPSAYDLVGVPQDEALPLLLWEAKTIDGDAPVQVRLAIGQLAYYEHFEVRPTWPNRAVERIAVFDGAIGEELAVFLGEEGVAAYFLDGGRLVPLNERAASLATLVESLGLPPTGE